jgi:DNA processing protein
LTEPPDLSGQLQDTWSWLTASDAGQQRRIVTLADSGYPAALLETADPPLLLYLTGQLDPAWPCAIAIVGSRNPTPQGLVNARQFAASFAGAGFCVVSGMALGVDGAAHEGALEAAGPGQLATIAVVGTGLDRVYPGRHRALAHRIASRGLLVSEYPLGTPPLAINFPRRNRIIAALSRGTLVVEAALNSGSLITARQAAEQGREVFAIPGSIHSAQSRGCHALLKEGAKLVETAHDVLEELKGHAEALPAKPRLPSDDAQTGDDQGDAVTRALGFDPVGLDALVARTGIAPADLLARLLQLELSGAVARLPGGLFQRIAVA